MSRYRRLGLVEYLKWLDLVECRPRKRLGLVEARPIRGPSSWIGLIAPVE